jgi:hypothetical protein
MHKHNCFGNIHGVNIIRLILVAKEMTIYIHAGLITGIDRSLISTASVDLCRVVRDSSHPN